MVSLYLNNDVRSGAIELEACLSSGCMKYKEDGVQSFFQCDEHINRDGENVHIKREFMLTKRIAFEQYKNIFITNAVVLIEGKKAPEHVKDVYDAIELFVSQCAKGGRHVEIRTDIKNDMGMNIMLHLLRTVNADKTHVTISLTAYYKGENILYYYDGFIKDPLKVIKTEARKAMGWIMAFADYVNNPPLKEGQDRDKA